MKIADNYFRLGTENAFVILSKAKNVLKNSDPDPKLWLYCRLYGLMAVQNIRRGA